MTPRISVLMPSYNHAGYVEEAVRSALAAADQVADLTSGAGDTEVVVLDDGSQDGTVERLRAIDDSRLRVLVQENSGAHAAFNRLLSMARGELVFLLNSDDVYQTNRLARLLAHFDAEPEVVAIGTWLEVIDPAGESLGIKEAWRTMPPWPPPRGHAARLSDLRDPSLALLESNYLATTSNIAFRRSAADGLSFQNLRYCHDWDFFLSLARRGRLELIEEPLVRYRVHPNNTLKETETETSNAETSGTATSGTAKMRFEIQWLLARHAHQLIRAATDRGREAEDLRRRLWASLPHFGAESLLLQLLAWRGCDDQAPASFDDLLALDHPFRRQAEKALSETPR